MCAIGRPRYVCFSCRRCISSYGVRCSLPENIKCPECHELMVFAGPEFKAPRRSNLTQWKKVQLLIENGFRFGACCGHPSLRPGVMPIDSLGDVKRKLNE